MSNIVKVLKRLASFLKPPTAVIKTRATLKEASDFLNPSKKGAFILNLGSGSTFYGSHVINLDIVQRPHVSVIGDAHRLPFQSDSLDAVFCQAVLEHVPQPSIVVAEIRRVLKPGGKVYVDVPFNYPYHDQIDFQRYTRDGLIELFKDFESLDVGVSVGPATAMVYQIRWTMAALLSFNNTLLFSAWKLLLGWLLFPLGYLNVLLRHNQFAWQCATGYRLLARKTDRQARDITQPGEVYWSSRHSPEAVTK
jgi:SAM-dependent methyltransferase